MANYRVSTLITTETMQTNMSPLTDLDMHDQFAKPQSNTTSFPGSFILPPPGAFAPGGGKMKDPGNEVESNSAVLLKKSTLP